MPASSLDAISNLTCSPESADTRSEENPTTPSYDPIIPRAPHAATSNSNRVMAALPAAPVRVHPLSSEILPPSSCIMRLAHPRENPMRLWSQVFVFTMLVATFALGPAPGHAQNVRVRGTIEQ